eukprot:m51a1_g5080 putative small gtp-binding protein rab1 (226) ;mRNA; r:233707-234384
MLSEFANSAGPSVSSYPPGTVVPRPDHLFKVLMIGESGVGKSALLTRFAEGGFDSSYMSTIGVDFKIHYMHTDSNKDIKLQVWDTAGQERFRTITASFYRRAHGVVVVYDATDAASFERVAYWLEQIRDNVGARVPLMLVCNKVDLDKHRAVDAAAARRFADRVGIPLRETSAKTGQGVNEAFGELVSMIVRKSAQDLRDELRPVVEPAPVARPPPRRGSCCSIQ